MRYLMWAAVIALAVWTGWWWLASTAHKQAWALWLEDRADAGWVAEYDALTVRGFPNRLDTTISGLQLADPASGWAWSAPIFQVLSLSYKPNHVIAVWPERQRVSSPGGTAEVTAETLRGSLVFVPGTDLALDRMQLEIADLVIETPDGRAVLDVAHFATRRSVAGMAPANSHDIGLDITGLRLPLPVKLNLDPTGLLPDRFETAHLDMSVAYDAPWDRHAIEGRKPQPRAISLKKLALSWGDLTLNARGNLEVDRSGYPNGDITIKARNWQQILKVLVAAEILPPDLAAQIRSGLGLLAGLSGDPRSIDIPLSFAGGQTFIGPIPLGPAPRLTTD